jgi:ribonuclease P protein component
MRLVRAGDFARVYKSGSRARGDLVTVAAVRNDSSGADALSRLGLSIGKRVWKSAVKRNRVRRVFREAFRLSYDELPRGFDFVVIGSTPSLTTDLAAAEREFVRLARKAARRADERQPDRARAEERPGHGAADATERGGAPRAGGPEDPR